jgi:hypothetical protein
MSNSPALSYRTLTFEFGLEEPRRFVCPKYPFAFISLSSSRLTLEKITVNQALMEPEGSQEPAFSPYPETDKSSPHPPTLRP